ncbi:MAG TPA: hypothetical protein VMD04_03375 [Candidatus Margulisiibacteriota bacterium]|nr:hypothetical protein [Candidatus Margulisiibacteriota bacterium]
MEKRESLKKEPLIPEKDFAPAPSGIGAKLSGLYNKSFGVLKLILGICLLPFVYSSVVSFLNELSLVEKPLQGLFWWGSVSFLGVYLFVWEPAVIYTRGHKLLELIFNFFKPLVRVAPYLLPIYTIVLFLLYGLFSLFTKSGWLIEYTVFLSGFSLILHLVFSAKTLRTKKQDFLKANYIFGFSFIFILNLALLSFCLSTIFKRFSFVDFVNTSFAIARDLFVALFDQLFRNKPMAV